MWSRRSYLIAVSSTADQRSFPVSCAIKSNVKSLNIPRKWNRPSFSSKVWTLRRQRSNWRRCSASSERWKTFEWFVTSESLDEIGISCVHLSKSIVCFRNGNPKGIAYVEFDDEKAASTAIMKLDQTEFDGFKINVAISAPPRSRLPIVVRSVGWWHSARADGIRQPKGEWWI